VDVEKIRARLVVAHFLPQKWETTSLALIFSLLACAALAWGAPLPQSDAESLPDGPGKDTFASVCSLCHSSTAPMGKQWTRQQWELKVSEMLQEEPDVTREERATIVEYLAANFNPGGKIYINKADAKDLETALEIPATEAEAIVLYRKARGDFKTFDDLKKIPNVNVARIEGKKDRLQF
jgi:competence protein ComEA